jgi:serine/threonine-protein kinase
MLWAPWRAAPEPATPVRLSVELGADASLAVDFGPAATLSPDGAVLAFVATKSTGGPRQLYVRRLDQLAASPLSGTEDAASPFFSPDGQWIAFFAGGKLKKFSVTGGAAATLCDAPDGRGGGTWAENGTIVFLAEGSGGESLLRVSSAGGTPEALTPLDPPERTQRWPQVLPGGKAVLYTGHIVKTEFENANLVVQPLPKGIRKVVQRGGYHGRYLRSGHLVFIREGTLLAAPFDLDRLELTGPPVPALEGVTANSANGGAQFAFSGNGTLIYMPGQSAGFSAPIHWMDREGKTTPLRAAPANWGNIFFSPDGRRLAMQIHDGSQSDVWVYEWERDTLTRLTFDATNDRKPVWTTDGGRIVFLSRRADNTANLYWQQANGTGEAERLTESKNPQVPASWHPSGKFLAFCEINPQTGNDLMILPMEGDEASGWKPGKPTVFLNSPFEEQEPMFSPDGRWLAYQSNESGRREVYVRSFPGGGGKSQISTDGGAFATWSQTRQELFYGTNDQRIMVVPYTVEGDAFRAEKPKPWSPALVRPRGPWRSFDLHRDEKRVAVLKSEEGSAEVKRDHVVFIENFFEELRRLAPAGER